MLVNYSKQLNYWESVTRFSTSVAFTNKSSLKIATKNAFDFRFYWEKKTLIKVEDPMRLALALAGRALATAGASGDWGQRSQGGPEPHRLHTRHATMSHFLALLDF